VPLCDKSAIDAGLAAPMPACLAHPRPFLLVTIFRTILAALACLAASAPGQVLLIENLDGFGGAAAPLRGEGFDVTVVNGELANNHANLLDADFLDDFHFVIYGERGSGAGTPGAGTPLPANVAAALEAYLQTGGNLLVTGSDTAFDFDTLNGPDPELSDLVRVTNVGANLSSDSTWVTSSLDHPILNGPYGDFRNTTFTADSFNDAGLDPDTSRGAIELVTTGSAKLIFTDLPDPAGTVGIWNGGLFAVGGGGGFAEGENAQPNFSDGDEPESLFRNYVHFIERGFAGPDIEIGDSNEDGFVTIRFDGSEALAIDPGIDSWEWSWTGGGPVSGQFAEATFPADNTPRTVTLTATNSGSGVSRVDRLRLTPYTLTDGLFTEFRDPFYVGVDTSTAASQLVATLEGDTLVIDPLKTGVPEVYRRSGGVWNPTPFTPSIVDIRAIDEDTLLSANLPNNSGFRVHRWTGSGWTDSALSLSILPPKFSRFDYAFDPGAMVYADFFNNTYGSQAGLVLAYDWVGDTLTHTELLPPGGVVPGQRWGSAIDVEGDLIAVRDGLTPGANLKLFTRQGGGWAHTASLAPDLSDSFGDISIGNGIIAALTDSPDAVSVIESNGGSWVQTELPLNPLVGFSGYVRLIMDDDGDSFVASDADGHHILYQKDDPGSDWASSTVTQRRLLTADMDPVPTSFSGDEIVLSDPIFGIVRIFDEDAPFDTVNAEPIADAGVDISTTSFDGEPVQLFLNGGGTTDFNFDETFDAIWNWDGGEAVGLQAFASIATTVTSITLTVTDSRGAVSRDTIAVDIVSPPVLEQPDEVIVVDRDGDGIIRLAVEGQVASQDFPIAAWSWRFPGGVLDGREGILTLRAAANDKSVVLEVIDTNGLSSETSFDFTLLDPNPTPDVIQAIDGTPLAGFGDSVAIEDGIALIGSPEKLTSGTTTGASYLAQNLNNTWQQLSLAPGTLQGDDVLIDGDLAFVGAKKSGANPGGFSSQGQVVVYQRGPSGWAPIQTLTPPDAGGWFGESIARSGNRLLIGAPRWTGVTLAQGAAYLYEHDGSSWVFAEKFNTPNPTNTNRFGNEVAIAGDSLAITQVGFASTEISTVYVYTRGTSSWSLDATLQSDLPAGPRGNDEYHFGQALAMNETELLVGSPNGGPPGQPGESLVYRYQFNGTNWLFDEKIDPGIDFFGSSLALFDGALAVGSLLDGGGGSSMPGSVTSFVLRDGDWVESGSLEPDALAGPYTFGDDPNYAFSLDHDGRDLIVGVPGARSGIGQEVGRALVYRNFAGVSAAANFEPIADAGTYATFSDTLVRGPAPDYLVIEPLGSEPVLLDGSGSSDQEDAIVSWEWSWDDTGASGEMVTARFPVGTTTVTLTVTDDAGIVNSDTVDIIVELPQTDADPLPADSHLLTVDLPVTDARWRLSSQFDWQGDGATIGNLVADGEYRLEVIAFPGSPQVFSLPIVTDADASTSVDVLLELPVPAVATGQLSFVENGENFAWRRRGAASWNTVPDDGDGIENERVATSLPVGSYVIEFRPTAGFTTPALRAINVVQGVTQSLDWDYIRIDSYDPAKRFGLVASPDLEGDPYQHQGMIRTPLGRGSGTVVLPRVVLSAAHLFFDPIGIQWAGSEWFARHQHGTRQAPPRTPRGVLYKTSYAEFVAPGSTGGGGTGGLESAQEADFAVLFFSGAGDWSQGAANFLQSTSERNWLTGGEPKLASGYPQRTQAFPDKGKVFEKGFATPLTALDANPLPLVYQTTELFGDGGASGSALWVNPPGSSRRYPAAILLAGQARAVYRIIDADVVRMIKDGEDAATGNDEVLDSSSSLVTFDNLGLLNTVGINVSPASIESAVRWSITPNTGAGFANLTATQTVPLNATWDSFTVEFGAVSDYAPPAPTTVDASALGSSLVLDVTYDPLTPYDTWKLEKAVPGDLFDGDGDGRVAILEYSQDTDPDEADTSIPLRVVEKPSQATYAEFELYLSEAAEGVRYVVVASNTLDFASTDVLGTFTSANAPAGGDYLVVTDVQERSASTTRFARVEVFNQRTQPAE